MVPPYANQIIWGNVLRSVGAEQSYPPRSLRAAVDPADVAQYLLEDEQYPRTILHCLHAMDDSACKLPLAEPVVLALADLQRTYLPTYIMTCWMIRFANI